jgi:hypothetical protein
MARIGHIAVTATDVSTQQVRENEESSGLAVVGSASKDAPSELLTIAIRQNPFRIQIREKRRAARDTTLSE